MSLFLAISIVLQHEHTTWVVGTELLAEVPKVVQIFWHVKRVQLHQLIALLTIHFGQRHRFAFIGPGFLHISVDRVQLLIK